MIFDTNPPVSLVREIFIEYSQVPGVDLQREVFERELKTLPLPYQMIILAMDGGHPAACVALRQLGGGFGELKRLYVRPAYRGEGLAKTLIRMVIDEARLSGFGGVRLDTLATMGPAIALYLSLGFREIPHYGEEREQGLRYLEIAT